MVVCLLQGGSRCLLQYNQTGLCLYFEVNIAFDTFSGRKFCSLELSIDSKERQKENQRLQMQLNRDEH
jgi:hypothetical protein